jgi:hypothetical protein
MHGRIDGNPVNRGRARERQEEEKSSQAERSFHVDFIIGTGGKQVNNAS